MPSLFPSPTLRLLPLSLWLGRALRRPPSLEILPALGEQRGGQQLVVPRLGQTGPSGADTPEHSPGQVCLCCPREGEMGPRILLWSELTTRAIGYGICQMSQLIAKFVLPDKW